MKDESNNPTNANVEAGGKRALEMPLFELPKMAMPGIFLRDSRAERRPGEGKLREDEGCLRRNG